MMNKIDSIITTVENGLFAVLGEAPAPARRAARATSRRAVRKSVKKTSRKVKKVRKKRK